MEHAALVSLVAVFLGLAPGSVRTWIRTRAVGPLATRPDGLAAAVFFTSLAGAVLAVWWIGGASGHLARGWAALVPLVGVFATRTILLCGWVAAWRGTAGCRRLPG